MYNEETCRFLKTHEWAFAEGENAVVGISNHAQEEISDIVFVDLPKVGRVVKAGENCCVIESVKSASEIYAPVSGEIIAVNEALKGYNNVGGRFFFNGKRYSKARRNNIIIGNHRFW